MGLFDFFKKKPKFKIGDNVVCIDDRDHPIEFKKEYKILDIAKCGCKKDCYSYNVGIPVDNNVHCSDCRVVFPGRNIFWAEEHRFELMNTKKFLHGNFIYGKKKKRC